MRIKGVGGNGRKAPAGGVERAHDGSKTLKEATRALYCARCYSLPGLEQPAHSTTSNPWGQRARCSAIIV